MPEGHHPKPDKTVVYMFMAVAMLGLAFFVYNWWKCKQSKIIEEQYDYNGEDEFRGTNMYNKDKI